MRCTHGLSRCIKKALAYIRRPWGLPGRSPRRLPIKNDVHVAHVGCNGIPVSNRYGCIKWGGGGGRECEIEAGRTTWARGENRAPRWESFSMAAADVGEPVRLCVTPYAHVGTDFLKGCGCCAGVDRLQDGIEEWGIFLGEGRVGGVAENETQ